MLLGEPPRTDYDLNFQVAGFPVRVHPFFWIVSILLAHTFDPMAMLIWVSVVFVSILVHELGHAFTMRNFGYQPSITLYGMGGLASYNPGFTSSFQSYGRRGNDAQSQILISAAGPAAGFALAGVVVALLYAGDRKVPFFFGIEIGRGDFLQGEMMELVFSLLFVNILWSLINLFPVYPLDGGQIARELFLSYNPSDGLRQSLVLSIATAAALSAFALLQGRSLFVALLFGFLAYGSYQMLQGGGYGGFGGGFGRRPW